MLHKIRAIVIDDEKPARELMLAALKTFEQIEIIGLCSNAIEAKEMIEREKPHVVFLDIEMPPINGFELLVTLTFIPEIIFCTAYNQFAIKAFEQNALDYILKPIIKQRLEAAITKLEEKIALNSSKYLTSFKLLLQNGNQYFLTNLDEIFLLEAEGNYVKHCFKDKQILKFISIKTLQEELPPEHFVKINRSQIVNKNYIQSLKDNGRNILLLLKNGQELQVSRIFTAELKGYK
jgi:two-component system, LytTR family, response regulator